MPNQPINQKTEQEIAAYLKNPGQAVGLIGQKWLNKGWLAKNLTSKLLEIPPEDLVKYPYHLNIGNNDLAFITIDEIRAINDFILLKVPLKKAITRVIIIERAERLRLEAQNALLKNLEEPPRGTIYILTAESVSSLLPTITSRLSVINVLKPSKDTLKVYYEDLGYSQDDINQALLVSDGLPALTDELLTNEDNSISEVITKSRKLLSSSTFERLSSINDLSKNKSDLASVFFVIKQMAKIGVASSDAKSALKWQKILAATLNTEQKLNSNVQLKLLLTDYMLSIG